MFKFEWKLPNADNVEVSLLPGGESTLRPPYKDTTSRYARIAWAKNRQRLRRYTPEDMRGNFLTYTSKLEQLVKIFSPILSTYDTQVVLPTTCDLGGHKPCHFDLDEKHILGVTRRYLFPNTIIDRVCSFYKRLPNYSEVLKELPSMSMKRGTNLGYPTQKSGRSRSESDLLLSWHVMVALAAKKQQIPLSQLTSQLERIFGPCFAVGGERYQHTGKKIPCFVSGAHMSSQNFEPRVRGIYFSPKYMVAYNRMRVKQMLKLIMSSPHHQQDRAYLKKFFAKRSPDCYVSLDVSKFDQSHGGKQGEQMIAMIAHILGMSPEEHESFLHEFYTPVYVTSRFGLMQAPGGLILSSGLSMTTLIGCMASECIAESVRDFVSAKAGRSLVDFDYQTWGDDIVLSFESPQIARLFLSNIDEFSKSLELTFTEEPTLKFLGQNYNMRGFTGTTDYPVGRFIQQQMFPERVKLFPFSFIGYYARLNLLHPSLRKDVHRFMKILWEDPNYKLNLGPFVPFEKLDAAIRPLIVDLQKSSDKISQMDDILSVITHGLQIDDADLSKMGLSDEFTELLGQTVVDVSDPLKFLREDVGIDPAYLQASNLLIKGDLSRVYESLTQLLTSQKLRPPTRGETYF